MLRKRLVAALIAFCVALLLLPELLPAAARGVVTAVAFAASAAAVVALRQWPYFRIAVIVFWGAVWFSWFVLPSSLRHVAGISLGLGCTALIATWARTQARLMVVTAALAIGGAGLLLVGVAAAPLDNSKFINTASERPTRLFPWLPEIRLPLPNLELGGRVNPNALGGLALLVAPIALGLLVAARRLTDHRRAATVIAGITSAVSVAVLALSLSRTSYVAALLTAIVLGLAWGRARTVVIITCLAVYAAGATGALYWQSTAPERFERAVSLTQDRVWERQAIWYDGVDALMVSPMTGVGINQFHAVTRSPGSYGSGRVPHAHNTLLQTALDIGLIGFGAYVALLLCTFGLAIAAVRRGGAPAGVAAGGAMSILAIHFFGIGDAIALGAKVGLVQWAATGLVLAAWRVGRGPGAAPIGARAAISSKTPAPPE